MGLRRAHTDGAGDRRAARSSRAEIVDVLNRQQFRKCDACAVDAAFDRANGAAADFISLFVGEARGADED
jgi:hypothetical protein